jgi:hypothetical protein
MGGDRTTIGDDVLAIKRLADEMRCPRTRPFYATCDDCGDRLYHEPGFPGADDEPPSDSGWFCYSCNDWKE